MKRSWLVLSPHFDDAVLSIPLWMSQQVDKGDRVLVATLFSAAAPNDPTIMKIRQAEDNQAMEMLGCESVSLGFTDAPYRSPPRTSFCPIVFDGIGADQPLITSLQGAIGELATQYPDTQIVAPMAVGTHIDHRLTFLASASCAHYFYEDRPYALIRGAVKHRLGQLGAGPRLDEKEMSEYVKDYLLAGYVQSFLADNEIPRVKHLLQASNNPAKASLQVKPRSVEATNYQQAQQAGRAIKAYTSQIDGLFPTGIETFWTNEILWEQIAGS